MIDETLTTESLPPQPRSRHGFRIAIICALPLEAEMVELVLDHDWNDSGARYGKATGDKNTYTTGVIAGHNVVLAYMPSMGGIDAAGVATGLRSSFPKIEFAFVVGICGVVPTDPRTKQDIFLGDCIISTSVVQYDLGAQYPAGCKRKDGLDSLGRASQEVRSLIVKLNTRRNQEQLTKRMRLHLKDLLQGCRDVAFPGVQRDRLFKATYVHQHMNIECDSCRKDVGTCTKDCDTIGCDTSFTIYREHLSLEPRIHFGRFGSANTVMKSGEHRDRIAGEDLIAFEMEGAGVWDVFPTIVIKSACDYADSHKSKEWQGYAAASAAAGLKSVLEKLELSDEAIVQDTQLPARNGNGLNAIEVECLQSLCLQPSYRDMKDRIPERVSGTCNWALSQTVYKDWLHSDGRKLLISADPGCGKSVLAKYLVDEELPRVLPGFVICYYFFKDQVQNKLAPALCAICHQLMAGNYNLLRKYAVPYYQKDKNIASDIGTLVEIIKNAISDGTSQSFVVVFDALDECETGDCTRLIRMLEQLDGAKKLKIILTSRPYYGIVSDFETVSSRLHIPGEEESDAISEEVEIVIKQRLEVLCQQRKLDSHIRAELKSRLLAQDHRTYLWVYLVFDELETALKMTARELGVFFGNLPRTVNEAYERILSKHTHDSSIQRIVQATLLILLAAYEPLTITQLQYAIKARILPDAKYLTDLDIELDRDFIVKLRNWCGLFVQIHNDKVTFIHQTAREFLIANNTLDIQAVTENKLWTGFCTIEKAHELMARACIAYILLFSSLCEEDETQDHAEWGYRPEQEVPPEGKLLRYAAQYWDMHVRDGACTDDQELLERMSFLCKEEGLFDLWFSYRVEYEFYYEYCRQEDLKRGNERFSYLIAVSYLHTDALIQSALVDTPVEFEDVLRTQYSTLAEVAVDLAHAKNLRLLLDYADRHDIEFDPHVWIRDAISHQSNDILELLLEHKASTNMLASKGYNGESHLFLALHQETYDAVRLLVQYGVDLEETDYKGNTPLHYAIERRSSAIATFLLDHGANIHVVGKTGQTYLHQVISHRMDNYVSVLLDHGSNIEARDNEGDTPLHQAAMVGNNTGVCLLLNHGAKIDPPNNHGMTPLARAICTRHFEVVQYLLRHNADVNHQDNYGRSILHHAINPQLTRNGLIDRRPIYFTNLHYLSDDDEVKEYLDRELNYGYDLIRLLLEHGARLDLQNKDGYTPLYLAVHYQMKKTVQILLDYGKESLPAEIRPHVPYICIQEHRPLLLELLISSGVNISIQHEEGHWFVHGLLRNYHGGVIFHIACYVKSEQIHKLVGYSKLKAIQNMEPWRHALNIDYEDLLMNRTSPVVPYVEYTKAVKLACYYDLDFESRDVLGCSPLLSYCRLGYEWAVKRLLDYGFDIGCRDIFGGTPLHWASRYGSEELVRLLIEHFVDVNASQDSGFTALTVAMLYENFRIFKFLLGCNANPEIPDVHGRRIVHHAVCLGFSPSASAFLSYLLRTQNVDIDAKDHGGWTALHWASARGFYVAAMTLMYYKASPNIRDDRGRTPLDYAKVLGHNDVAALLAQHNSDTQT